MLETQNCLIANFSIFTKMLTSKHFWSVLSQLKSQQQGFEKWSSNSFYKSNLLGKADFLLKSGLQVIAFFIPLEVGYRIIIVVNFVYKWAHQLFLGHHKIMSDWFTFSNIFPIGGLISLWSHGFTIFQSRLPKWLLSNSKVLNKR